MNQTYLTMAGLQGIVKKMFRPKNAASRTRPGSRNLEYASMCSVVISECTGRSEKLIQSRALTLRQSWMSHI